MLDRQKVEAILTRRFAGAPTHEIAAAANAIMGLASESQDVIDGKRGSADYCDIGDEPDRRRFPRRTA